MRQTLDAQWRAKRQTWPLGKGGAGKPRTLETSWPLIREMIESRLEKLKLMSRLRSRMLPLMVRPMSNWRETWPLADIVCENETERMLKFWKKLWIALRSQFHEALLPRIRFVSPVTASLMS